MSTQPQTQTVAVLSSTDLPGFADQILARVVDGELTRRLPGWRVEHYAPLGWERPHIGDGGFVARPLTGADLGHASLIVLCPGFTLGTDLAALYGTERAVSPAMSGLVDRPLVLSGVDAVPHLAVASGLLVDPDSAPERVAQLRQQGALPDGEYAVLTGEPSSPTAWRVERAAQAIGVEHVVRLTDPQTDSADSTLTLADLAIEDRLAVLAGARLVITTDEHAAAAAAGVGARWIMIDPTAESASVVAEFADARHVVNAPDQLNAAAKTDVPALNADVLARVAAHFDEIAAVAKSLPDNTTPDRSDLEAEVRALRAANARLRARIRVERDRFADALGQARLENAELVRQAEENGRLVPELVELTAAQQRELNAWQDTKLVRWTTPARRAYAKARRLPR